MKNIVVGILVLQVDHDGTCRGCALGKNAKKFFPDSESRSKEILDLVHSDLCGPMTIASLGGYDYYVTFNDDYSWKTWIYFLKTKESEEVLSKFKDFKAQVKNLSGKRIKILRSGNGGEYTSREFNDFYKEVGINRELTTPSNPQQNRVPERKNRTVVEAAKAMIHDQLLPMFLWEEASIIVLYVQKICPHKTVKNMTHEDAFTGVKTEVGHL